MAKKKLYAHILLDRSGSMEDCRDTTIDAFNEYVNSLRSDENLSARISLTLFDDQSIDLIHNRVKARDLPRLTRDVFVPRGMTPLNDAIGRTVIAMDKAELREEERVALVILTDGLENASVEHTKETVKALLERCQTEKNWLVIYLGANHDAFAESHARGIAPARSMVFDKPRLSATVGAMARMSRSYAESGDAQSAEFTPSERASARR